MNNIIDELKKLDKQAWADYGVVDNIFEKNGMDWNSVNDKFGDYLERILDRDDIENILSNRIEDNESYLEREQVDDDTIDTIKQSIKDDTDDIKYYNQVDGALYQHCEGGDYEFYRLTNEVLVDMLEFIK